MLIRYQGQLNHQSFEVHLENLARAVSNMLPVYSSTLKLATGHAIWIGNLPPQTELMNLVFHVCKEAPGLESLFLISKSNCAFANFKDEASCTEAQGKIHDSRFQTVRLVSRLRRSSVGTAGGVAIPTGPAALSPPTKPLVVSSPSQESELNDRESNEADGEVTEDGVVKETALPKDKFFIVKSLTVEDLELSVRNGIWATQSHNEEALNKAYQVWKAPTIIRSLC